MAAEDEKKKATEGDAVDEELVQAKREDADVEKPSVTSEEHATDGGYFASRPTQFDRNGDPIINTGYDVSRYLISLRDDGDEALTLRSWVLGILLGLANNLLGALFKAKPTSASFTDIFNMLLLYIMGCTWAFVLPTAESFHQEGKAWDTARRMMRVVNPSKTFGLKEHAISLIIASIGFLGGYAVDALATAKLFFNAHLNPAKVILGLFSLSTIGLGLVGVLAPAIVYPSELVYWNGIPTCHGFQALHYSKGDQVDRRRKTFGWCLLAAFTWEFVPAYMAPWLNGISIPCLASMHASENRRKTISRIFGGASANQGLGLFSISLDPQYVPFSTFAGSPTKFLIPYFSGAILGAFILIALYQTNVWNAKAYPFMSSTLYTATGDAWDQNAVFDPQYRLNETGLAEQGLPRMAVSEAFSIMTTALGLGALIAHVLLFLSKTVIEDFRRVRNGSLDDPHYQAMKKYKAVPQKVWLLFMALGVPAAFVTIYVGHTTLPWWGLVVALVFGVLMTPISLSIYGRFGSAVPTMMISKMISGACHPDHPVANLWFALYSHNIVEVSGTVAGYLKLGQYLKLPPRLNLAAQLTSVLLGAFTQWIMTSAIIDRHADILRDPQGDAYWFGGLWQDANVEATEWSMASRVFAVSSGTDYEWLPLGIMIGACFPLAHWLLTKRVKFIRDLGDLINLPIFLYYLATLSGGVNSAFFSSMLLAYASQHWLRTHRPKWFIEFNYIIAAGVDGGVAIMVFLLAFAVQGAMGVAHPFPTWFGNPAAPEAPDHCLRGDA